MIAFALAMQPFLKAIPVALDIAEHARELARTTPGLSKRQDAVHLASALRRDAAVFHTYDKADLLHLSEQFPSRNGRPLQSVIPVRLLMARSLPNSIKDNEQSDRFIETARALGADEDGAAFRTKLAVIARQKPKAPPLKDDKR